MSNNTPDPRTMNYVNTSLYTLINKYYMNHKIPT